MSNDDLSLAITTIGHLLLENKIQDKNGTSIDDINLKIPKYQRPYSWPVVDAIRLLDDIRDAEKANKKIYHVGTLILHKAIPENDDDKRHEYVHNIVDGQQRIITFSLLLKALNEKFSFDFLKHPLANNSENIKNISNNFQNLKKRIERIKDTENRLLDFIKNKCKFIVVITKNISEAFQFFDSQNARGKKLYPHDLLKAYHLREMNNLDTTETEKILEGWHNAKKEVLSKFFNEYLYRVKEWMKGNKALEETLTDKNIHMFIHIFKGFTKHDNFPYAQFYKGAYAYNYIAKHYELPFAFNIVNLKSFQLDAPIIAGKLFFDYTKHYFGIYDDIENCDKYEAHFINDNPIIKTLNLNPIIKTLNLPKYKIRTGDEKTRNLLNTALFLYIDRFYPEKPTPQDAEMLEQFIIFAFVWAYSLRALSTRVGWDQVKKYIKSTPGEYKINSFNIYRVIAEAHSPGLLLGALSVMLKPLQQNEQIKLEDSKISDIEKIKETDNKNVNISYIFHFNYHGFLEEKNGN